MRGSWGDARRGEFAATSRRGEFAATSNRGVLDRSCRALWMNDGARRYDSRNNPAARRGATRPGLLSERERAGGDRQLETEPSIAGRGEFAATAPRHGPQFT